MVIFQKSEILKRALLEDDVWTVAQIYLSVAFMYTHYATKFLTMQIDATSRRDKMECGDTKQDQFGCNLQ